MKTDMMGGSWRGVAILSAALLFAGGCADEPAGPFDVARDEGPVTAPPLAVQLFCTVGVAEGTMSCDSLGGVDDAATGPGTTAGGPNLNLIVGNQHQFVRMANDAPTMAGDLWSANVTVQNLTLQPMGTLDGTTPSPQGVRVFFVDEPSNGVQIANYDSVKAFTGSAPQKYYQYADTALGADRILTPGEKSRARRWEFTLNGATTFRFSVLIAADMPDVGGYSMHLTRVEAGATHACGDGADGKIYCWGGNFQGTLGIGVVSVMHTTPVAVVAPPGVTLSNVRAGHSHNCAEGSDGRGYCWGRNGSGQIGDGATTDRHLPTPVIAPEGVRLSNFAPGQYHTCAEGSDGKAYCWGSNANGELGDGTESEEGRLVPGAVSAPAGVTLTGLMAGNHYTCAEGSNGQAYCWGRSSGGRLGDGTEEDRAVPTRVAAPAGVRLTGLKGEHYHTCANGSDGYVYCWGYNTYGALGDGTRTSSTLPVRVGGGAFLSGVVVGQDHSCAADSNGNAYCWGEDSSGQAGIGTGEDKITPTRVRAPEGVGLSGLSAHYLSTCANGSDGKTYCWGSSAGGLGDGVSFRSNTPTPIAGTRRP